MPDRNVLLFLVSLSINEVKVLVQGFFMFLSAVFPRFFLVLNPRGRLGGKVGSACEEFKDYEGGILG